MLNLSAHGALPGHLFSQAPHSFGRKSARRLLGGWLGAEAGLEVCPSDIVEEGGGEWGESHSNVFNRNSSVPQSEFEISANFQLLS